MPNKDTTTTRFKRIHKYNVIKFLAIIWVPKKLGKFFLRPFEIQQFEFHSAKSNTSYCNVIDALWFSVL